MTRRYRVVIGGSNRRYNQHRATAGRIIGTGASEACWVRVALGSRRFTMRAKLTDAQVSALRAEGIACKPLKDDDLFD